jgi:hypothetical protein
MKKLYCCVTNDLNFDQRMMRICNSLQSNGYEVSLIGRKNKNSLTPTSKNYQQHQTPIIYAATLLLCYQTSRAAVFLSHAGVTIALFWVDEQRRK